MPKNSLSDHVFGTYVSLRYGLVVIGAALPLLVWAIALAQGITLQGSISAYYWASTQSRDVFVGSLFAVAACLYLYKGFTTRENVALNLAGVFAVGVALVPTGEPGASPQSGGLNVHGTCAILMFLCLAYVTWFRTEDTLSLLGPTQSRRYRKVYQTIALFMLAAPALAFILNFALSRERRHYIFYAEACGIWAFAAYWLTKSIEFKQSKPTKRSLAAAVAPSPSGKLVPVAGAPVPNAPVANVPVPPVPVANASVDAVG